MKTGILLVNLGTPDTPTLLAVRKYLTEFLTDPRVIDISWIKRQLLVRGVIIPLRVRQSTKSYQAIWTEGGSPLMIHSQKSKKLLQEKLGSDYCVELAMRYQSPSIELGLKNLLSKQLKELIILPLFPQYASATTGSIFEKVFKELKPYSILPKLTLIDQFYAHPAFIRAFKAVAEPFKHQDYDHILFSFHGLPERQLIKCNTKGLCRKEGCCEKLENKGCYAAQCHQTAHAIARICEISTSHYSICFQSRLGKEPWIPPFTSDRIEELAKNGAKKILVFCPAFVSDCLETVFEISVEYQELFQHAGGEKLDLVPSLNSHPAWIDALHEILHVPR